MSDLNSRLKHLEHQSDGDVLVITTCFSASDDEGNMMSDGYCVSGRGWGVRQEADEPENDFRRRAKEVAAQNGHPNLWGSQSLNITIGGE